MNNQVYEVDLIDLCRAVFKRWKLLVLCLVLFGAVGAGLSMANRTESKYSALVAVNVRTVSSSVSNGSSDSDTKSDSKGNADTNVSGESAMFGPNLQAQKEETLEATSKTESKSETSTATVSGTIADRVSLLAKLDTLCRTLLTQDQVLRNVAQKCDTDVSVVKQSISVGVVKDTNLIEIAAEADDPELAKKICEEVTNEAQGILMPALEADSVEIVSEPTVPEEIQTEGRLKKIVLFAFVGFVLAAAYVVLDYLLVPRVRTEMDVQKHLGMMLLGTVPTGKEKKGNG